MNAITIGKPLRPTHRRCGISGYLVISSLFWRWKGIDATHISELQSKL